MHASRTLDIDAPPAQVMAVLTDFASYPDFLSDMEAAEVVRRAGDSWEVRFRVRVVRALSYTLLLTQSGDSSLRWTLLEGALKSNEGGWTLSPLDGGSRTRAVYEIDIAVGVYVPGNIVRSLIERSLPETLSSFKAEIERRAAN